MFCPADPRSTWADLYTKLHNKTKQYHQSKQHNSARNNFKRVHRYTKKHVFILFASINLCFLLLLQPANSILKKILELFYLFIQFIHSQSTVDFPFTWTPMNKDDRRRKRDGCIELDTLKQSLQFHIAELNLQLLPRHWKKKKL